ncbi:alpha-glucan family phosphorylase [Desulfococcaceae bacterium HSG8]|nr:alpha-glucan family phosphorylase [Desulfococcaceae bacterium HSG8]
MSHLQTFQVYPDIPKPLTFLETLSRNLWWCWQRDAIELFRRIDPQIWRETGGNPIASATRIPQEYLEEVAKDDSFLAHQERVKQSFENEVLSPADRSESPFGENGIIAYFSMEFGIHESIPLFAGGLGILAGDHLKAASDMALPLVGVGLLYREGYFRQFLNQDGWQQEEYPITNIHHLPIRKVRDAAGEKIYVSVTGPDGEIRAALWKLQVGRIPLYLLDTNLPENPPEIREITARLYAGDATLRVAQEMLLGIGGMRALQALEIHPMVCHMNEGHSSFVALERLAHTISMHNVDLKTALEIVPRTTVFTTHTPVPAGHDVFPADIVRPYLKPFENPLGTSVDEIMSWGQEPGASKDSPVSMFILGLRMSQYRNGVSKLHGEVTRVMSLHVWPGVHEEEIPVTHITNGVHVSSWISRENSLLFERFLGPEWHRYPSAPDIINRIDEIYEEELWRAHEMSKSRLVRTCRMLMLKQYGRRNAPRSMMEDAETVLEQGILTIAFARRFATYKRAYLLLSDPERLEAMINSETRPIQIIFAGKAHPNDNEGKDLIRRIVEFARGRNVRHRIVFIEDYDIHLARHLVQGADVWLNNPARPHEACGTSGMKAAINGVLNFSVLDGWWCEGYNPDRGWQIGSGEGYDDHDYRDTVESRALYNILENEVIPCFYEKRGAGNAPSRWVKMMKASMKMGITDYSSHRMVADYEKKFYLPAAKRLETLHRDGLAEARYLAEQRKRIRSLWNYISIGPPVKEKEGAFRVGDAFRVVAEVHLGELRPDEVSLELYYGDMTSIDEMGSGKPLEMAVQEERGNGDYLYACTLNCETSGRYGITVRARPRGDERISFAPGLITWA